MLEINPDRTTISADGRDLSVVNVSVKDSRGTFVPTACVPVTITVSGPVRILGAGNGDPAFRSKERPEDSSASSFTIGTFNGLAQFMVQSSGGEGEASVTLTSAGGITPAEVRIKLVNK